MIHPLRIAIAEDEPVTLLDFKNGLTALGHEVVAAVSAGTELVRHCRLLRPDLIITDIGLPVIDGLEAVRQINAEQFVPVIVVSAHDDPQLIARAEAEQIFAYLVKPVEVVQLKTAIAMAISRFREFLALRQETDDLRLALQERKMVERAKGVLMKQANLAEAEAFGRLQELARQQNRKLGEVAEMVILAGEAFHGMIPPANRNSRPGRR